MSIFWSVFWVLVSGCTLAFLFDDGPDKHTIICCVTLGVIIGLDSALSEIKDRIERIERNKPYNYD